MKLQSIETKDIFGELETREGITTVPIESHVKVEVAGEVVEGPAIILINKDCYVVK
ncbi:BC1881 family protein [Bacillus cereus]|uniref:BC1881 family protein n=1 Tax=Bacillus cereus TaxID=1396 RepID=UPI003012B847